MIDRSIGRSVGRSVGRSIGRSVGRSGTRAHARMRTGDFYANFTSFRAHARMRAERALSDGRAIHPPRVVGTRRIADG